jgi:hypothetical protein
MYSDDTFFFSYFHQTILSDQITNRQNSELTSITGWCTDYQFATLQIVALKYIVLLEGIILIEVYMNVSICTKIEQ